MINDRNVSLVRRAQGHEDTKTLTLSSPDQGHRSRSVRVEKARVRRSSSARRAGVPPIPQTARREVSGLPARNEKAPPGTVRLKKAREAQNPLRLSLPT